jgi:hypothetical protein
MHQSFTGRPTAGVLSLLAVAIVTIAMAALLLPGRNVSAAHIPGATYAGNHDGGGTVDFDVSGDGSGITRFHATNIPGDTCVFNDIEVNFVTPVPIDNHSFSRQVNTGLSFDGTFPSAGNATGTLRARQSAIPFVQPACDSGVINWNASTNAPPPSDTATPTPTPTSEPTDSPTPTATSSPGDGEEVTWGDNNCSDTPPDPVDSLLALRFDAGLDTNTGDCPDMGQVVDVQNASPHPWGDVDCGGDVSPIDSLKLLRFDGGLPVDQEDGCPPIGSVVLVS